MKLPSWIGPSRKVDRESIYAGSRYTGYRSMFALRKLLKVFGISTDVFDNNAGNPSPFKIEKLCNKLEDDYGKM